MKLHSTAIEQLLKAYDTWGGYRENTKLKSALDKLDFSVYQRADGEAILVMTSDLEEAKARS